MKIIIKDKYTGNVKRFRNKEELIWYIDNYKYDLGMPLKKKYTVGNLLEIYFGGYKRIYEEDV